MPDLTEAIAAAREGLTNPRHALVDAPAHVPNSAGLYAIYGDASAWRDLGLGPPPDDRPLYVGKAEASLVTRDLRTHLGDGRTGSSTVRRSFAALLHDSLDLTAQPRNPHKPERPANYGLAPPGDQRLTKWMRDRLTLAVWPKALGIDLADVERALLESWLPALNLQGVNTPWSAQLSAARKATAGEARRWARERGFAI